MTRFLREPRYGRFAGSSISDEMPAAAPRPVWLCTLTGCSEMVRLEPPNSALAPTPMPTVAFIEPPK